MRCFRLEHADAGHVWRNVLEQLQISGIDRRLETQKACDVTARPRQALDGAGLYGVTTLDEHDWDRARQLLQDLHCGRGRRIDKVRPRADQRLGVRTDEVRIVAADDPKIDAQVAPLRPSELGKSLY